MTFTVKHLHLKTRDPEKTMRYYVDNFGATIKEAPEGRGFRLDLHGLQLNITDIVPTQTREQHYGAEHLAIETDDYAGTLANLRGNGVRILEESPPSRPQRICFLEAPDGVQLELIEKARPA